jgi:site-specific recombinase XerD
MQPLLERMASNLTLANRSERTRKSYLACARRFLEAAKPPPHVLDEDDVRDFFEARRTSPRGMSTSWQLMHYAALLALFEAAGRRHVMARIPRPKVLPNRAEVLTPSEVAAILAATERRKYRTLFLTAYAAGLRVGEVTRLQTRDIDAPNDLIHVRRGKGGKPRVVRLGKLLLEELRDYWRCTRPDGPWLFPARSGGPLDPRCVQRAFATAVRAAHIQRRVTPHTLRHSYATHSLAAGTDLRTLQVVLGHSRITTTERYLHLCTEHIRNVPSLLDRL